MSNPRVSVIMPIRATRDENVVWAQEAIASLKAQTYPDWELFLVSDRSTVSLLPLKPVIKEDNRIHAMKAKGVGVAAARNTGVEACNGMLLLPMDHDDILPEESMEVLVGAWDEEGKEFGVVYGDIISFGPDFERHMQMPNFLFQTLLKTLIMPIGSLHSKASSLEIGGWKDEFQGGLEDWAYWIEMAVNGYWGYHVPQVVYRYRRHPHGRLAALRTQDKFPVQQALIREYFEEYYNGKEPKMCRGCGKARTVAPRGNVAGAVRPPTPALFAAQAASNMVLVKYMGKRAAGFGITGKATGIKYVVPGGRGCLVENQQTGKVGVHPNDVQFFRGYDGGGTFVVEAV